ncbi:MAG: hypothetical protein NC235_07720 [Clostridiales bacterium]|nr:hypothetical protein [Clostridiales bacterium]
MDFIKFSVDTTNIFPMANTTKGGQLVTEYNLTARESISSDESIKYKSGPSYVHAEEDFFVSAQKPLDNFFPDMVSVSTSILQIAPGRGVVDGRFVESLVPIVIDLAAANAKCVAELETPIGGNLAVGLRVMYSTEQTMAGSVDAAVNTEIDSSEYFEGIQVVILPQDEFLLPTSKFTDADGNVIDCGLPENQGFVTAHLLLATFTYFNGTIDNIVNNYPAKCQMMPASRIGSINNIISNDFLKKTGLNEKKLYGLAGKGNTGGEMNHDTWCDITDSLIVWDSNVETTSDAEEIAEIEKYSQAEFITNGSSVALRLPHKQIDGETTGYDMENANGEKLVYRPRDLVLPVADFGSGTSGTVDKNYTNSIKAITNKINNFYHLTSRKQLMYIEELAQGEELPPINETWGKTWGTSGTVEPGDYILVGKDYNLSSELNGEQGINPPASIYVILPEKIVSLVYICNNSERDYITSKPNGIELHRIVKSEAPNIEDPQIYNLYWGDFESEAKRGTAKDYFTYEYNYVDDKNIEHVIEYYYKVSKTEGDYIYSSPIQITAQIPFATETSVGGFLNVPENAVDAGYVILDGNGNLRLLDYALLRSGTLAYQLGEDFTIPAGQSIVEVQAFLDEYVNQRIAFPNLNHSQTAENPNIIDITLNLSAIEDTEESETTLDLYDIDSRFQTAVRINIFGTANSKVKINISDCARVIINSNIGGNPTINLYRSCLYYDHEVLERLNNITDLSLWYSKFKGDDPSILVDGMTVKLADETGLLTSDYNIISREYWSPENINDFHFKVALQSLTFSSSGFIVGCGVLIGNDSTVNVRTGKFVIHDTKFELPQGPSTLRFPKNRFIKAVYVTGQFIACYRDEVNNKYNIQNTSFSLKTPCYTVGTDGYNSKNGEISFLVDSFLMDSPNPENIDVWNSGAFHLFNGSAIY